MRRFKTCLLLSFFLFFLATPSLAQPQSKIERAKDRLDNAGRSSRSYSDDDDDDDDGGDLVRDIVGEVAGAFLRALFEGDPDRRASRTSSYSSGSMCEEMFSYYFNISTANYDAQEIYYHEYPYYYDGLEKSFRSEEGTSPFRSQFNFNLGTDYEDTFRMYSFLYNFHYRGWALRLKFRRIEETGAPYPLNYVSGRVERESKVEDNVGFGFSLGVDRVSIDREYYAGPSFGCNFELYAIPSVSLVFNQGLMIYKTEYVSDISAGANFHFNRYLIGLEYNWFNVAGVKFDNVALKIGAYI